MRDGIFGWDYPPGVSEADFVDEEEEEEEEYDNMAEIDKEAERNEEE